MSIIKTKQLSDYIIKRADSIVSVQNKIYALPFGFDFSDNACIYYLNCNDADVPVSVLALFETDENEYEAVAFTDASSRRQGYFKGIFNFLINDLSKSRPLPKVRFLCDTGYAPAKMTADALSLTYEYTELMMELELDKFSDLKKEDIILLQTDEEHYNIKYKKKAIGSFEISGFSENSIYFFGFNIFEKFRGRGLGRQAMNSILLYFKKKGIKKIFLQVLLENTPAYRIYKGLGFETAEKISYYRM